VSVTFHKTLRVLFFVFLASSMAALGGSEIFFSSSQAAGEIRRTLELRVIAVRDPLARERLNEGLEHDLLWQFAQEKQMTLIWEWATSPREALAQMQSSKYQILAGRWTAESLQNRAPQLIQSLAYEDTEAQLICHRFLAPQDTPTSLWSRLWESRSEPPYNIQRPTFLRVAALQKDFSKKRISELESEHPNWRLYSSHHSPLQLARFVAKGNLDCFLSDLTLAKKLIGRYPWLSIQESTSESLAKVIAFHPDQTGLAGVFQKWMLQKNREGSIKKIRARYLLPVQTLSNLDRIQFERDRMNVLPTLKKQIQKYAKEFRLPWELLASVAYQESKWNNDARSYTGVRGIMQLTEQTAEHLGVTDRSDQSQSLWGGAKYLRELINQQPKTLHPREKLALALVAYNVGSGHLKDAQKLTLLNGGSEHLYYDIRRILPKLADPLVSDQLEFGPARGHEPVQFTDRVLAFYELLSSKNEIQ
jgi:membrane-bound lytic murein transglycosylase F